MAAGQTGTQHAAEGDRTDRHAARTRRRQDRQARSTQLTTARSTQPRPWAGSQARPATATHCGGPAAKHAQPPQPTAGGPRRLRGWATKGLTPTSPTSPASPTKRWNADAGLHAEGGHHPARCWGRERAAGEGGMLLGSMQRVQLRWGHGRGVHGSGQVGGGGGAYEVEPHRTGHPPSAAP